MKRFPILNGLTMNLIVWTRKINPKISNLRNNKFYEKFFENIKNI